MNQIDRITQAVENITAVLHEAEMVFQPFAPEDNATGFVVSFAESEQMGGLVYIFPEREQFAFYLIMLQPVPVETLARVAALITRLNNDLVIGNFELDYDEKTVQFKVSLAFQGVELSQPLVKNAVLAALDTVGTFSPAIRHVASGQQTVAEALGLAR